MYCRSLLTAVFSFVLLPLTAEAVTVQDIVSQVSQAEYAAFHGEKLFTHNGSNRGLDAQGVSTVQHDQARTNIFAEFQDFGLNPVLDPFTYTYNGHLNTYSNVVATLPGKVHPNRVYIVGAHYDSANNPGADDNASGVAGIVEAARALSQYQFDATLRFIAFDREEQGLVGSFAYANAHATDQILGAISLDMIAYNPTGDLHDQASVYYSNDTAPAITADLGNAVAQYGNLPVTIAKMPYAATDHYPFFANGFEAAALAERGLWGNPYYHESTDSVDTAGYIDYAYATNMTRGVVGYLATEAILVPEPGEFVILLVGGTALAVYRLRRRYL
jgi:hypothetical protein